MRPSAATVSIALHAAAVTGLLCLRSAGVIQARPHAKPSSRLVALPAPARWVNSSGGGQRDLLPASRGRLPPPPTRSVFVPPAAHILNEHPKLAIEQAIVLPPDAKFPDVALDRIGNPFGVDGPLSGGRGGPGGIGEGGCCGVGNGDGPGFGGTAVAHAEKPKRVTRRPQLVYKVEPEYSDDARRAKIQGIVLLAANVDIRGRLQDIRVVRPVGLGLDEKAIAAAMLWRFQPAVADDHPVSYPVTIEVSFRLL